MSSRSIQIVGGPDREGAEVEIGQRALRVYQVNDPGGGGGTEFAEDSSHTTGDLGTQMLAVRNDTPGSLVDTDGDYASLQLDATGRLRVAIDNSPTVTVGPTVTPGTGATNLGKAEDDAHTSGATGVMSLAVRNDTPGSLVDTDGDYAGLQVDAGGSLRVSIQDAAGTPVSIGVEGAGNQAALTVRSPYRVDDPQGNHALWPVGVVRVDTLGTLGPANGDYVHARTNNRGALWVAHDGDITVGTVTPGTGATSLGKAEDAAHTSGATGVMALAVRNDTPSALAGTNGDYIPLTTDSTGKLHVQARQATRTNLLTNSSLQLQGTDVVTGAGLAVARTQRVPVQNYGLAGLPQLTFNLSSVAESFGVSLVDPSAILAAGVSTALGGLSGTGGGLRTGPDRDTYVSLFSAQVFDNVTTTSNSASLDVSTARWGNVFIDLSEAGTPTDIRLIAQFSPDSGTTWFDYAVDQWVDLRYVEGQMPLAEVIPLNYVIPGLFRLRAVATGTTASDTFTLTAYIQVVS